MNIIKTLIVTVIAVVISVLGFIYSGHYDVSATSAHGGFLNWLMSTTMHESVERRAKDIKVPNLDDKTLQLAGINDFDSMCATCHGAPGKEPGAIGQGLNPPAPDLKETAAHSTPAELFWVTKHGIKMTGMPAWSASHGDEALWPVVAFMVLLPKLNADTYQSMLAGAKGSGHHAEDEAEHSHSAEGHADKQRAPEKKKIQQEKKHNHDDHEQ
jgi:mono/diheme cytochrome c family protein